MFESLKENLWLKLLHFRYREGFSDRAIRNYWTAIQDVFDIKDDPDKDTKVVIGIEARKIGSISLNIKFR